MSLNITTEFSASPVLLQNYHFLSYNLFHKNVPKKSLLPSSFISSITAVLGCPSSFFRRSSTVRTFFDISSTIILIRSPCHLNLDLIFYPLFGPHGFNSLGPFIASNMFSPQIYICWLHVVRLMTHVLGKL